MLPDTSLRMAENTSRAANWDFPSFLLVRRCTTPENSDASRFPNASISRVFRFGYAPEQNLPLLFLILNRTHRQETSMNTSTQISLGILYHPYLQNRFHLLTQSYQRGRSELPASQSQSERVCWVAFPTTRKVLMPRPDSQSSRQAFRSGPRFLSCCSCIHASINQSSLLV